MEGSCTHIYRSRAELGTGSADVEGREGRRDQVKTSYVTFAAIALSVVILVIITSVSGVDPTVLFTLAPIFLFGAMATVVVRLLLIGPSLQLYNQLVQRSRLPLLRKPRRSPGQRVRRPDQRRLRGRGGGPRRLDGQERETPAEPSGCRI